MRCVVSCVKPGKAHQDSPGNWYKISIIKYAWLCIFDGQDMFRSTSNTSCQWRGRCYGLVYSQALCLRNATHKSTPYNVVSFPLSKWSFSLAIHITLYPGKAKNTCKECSNMMFAKSMRHFSEGKKGKVKDSKSPFFLTYL